MCATTWRQGCHQPITSPVYRSRNTPSSSSSLLAVHTRSFQASAPFTFSRQGDTFWWRLQATVTKGLVGTFHLAERNLMMELNFSLDE